MKLIVGLGNPGSQYLLTRHNIGFIILDSFADAFKIRFRKGKGNWEEGEGTIDEEKIYLMKPMTYVNNSGFALKEFVDSYILDINNIIVIVDDFQIPLGTIRIRSKGSDGGHNGLSDIIYHLNSDEFPRMRVGIGKDEVIKKEEYVNFVLSNFVNEELGIIKEMIPYYNHCIRSFISEGITKTMNNCNKSFTKLSEDISNKKSQENKER